MLAMSNKSSLDGASCTSRAPSTSLRLASVFAFASLAMASACVVNPGNDGPDPNDDAGAAGDIGGGALDPSAAFDRASAPDSATPPSTPPTDGGVEPDPEGAPDAPSVDPAIDAVPPTDTRPPPDTTPPVDAASPVDTAPPIATALPVDAAPPPVDAAPTVTASGSGATYITSYVTMYGWPDNSPPGPAISNPKVHKVAGGTGTYADPITFATDIREFAAGTILYVPFIEKYVSMEDTCTACTADWGAGKHHIDIWMNSNAASTGKLTSCQDAWTRDSIAIELHPPSTRPVTTAPLFDTATALCRTTP